MHIHSVNPSQTVCNMSKRTCSFNTAPEKVSLSVLSLLHKSALVEGHSRVNSNSNKNCMLWPSHTLNKSLPAIVTYKSFILPDSIHLDHNLSTPIGSNKRFCLLITQSTTFKISFYSLGDKQRTDRLKHLLYMIICPLIHWTNRLCGYNFHTPLLIIILQMPLHLYLFHHMWLFIGLDYCVDFMQCSVLYFSQCIILSHLTPLCFMAFDSEYVNAYCKSGSGIYCLKKNTTVMQK